MEQIRTKKPVWLRCDVILSSVGINIMALAIPMVILQLYDRIIPNQSFSTLSMLGFGVLLSVLFEYIFRQSRSKVLTWIGIDHEHKINMKSFGHLMSASMRDVSKKGVGEHIDNVESASILREFEAGQGFTNLFDIPFVFIFLGIIAYLGGHLVWVPIICLIGFAVKAYFYGRKLDTAIMQRSDIDDRRYNFIIEVLQNYHSVKALGLENAILRRYERLQTQLVMIDFNVNFYSSEIREWGSLASYIMFASIVSYAALRINNGLLTTGIMSACILLGNRIFQPVQGALQTWVRYQQYSMAKLRMNEILSMDTFENNFPRPSKKKLIGHVQLLNVGFDYNPNKKSGERLLDGIDLSLNPGTITTIFGLNGCGKTTLCHLIQSQFLPIEGEIYFDGKPAQTYDVNWLQQKIAYLPPRGILFDGSIIENMTMFRKGNLVKQAIDASQFLGLEEWISQLPKGYETKIGDELFTTLPAGIQQRICLARILLSKPSVLILDESNNYLDEKGDIQLREILLKIKHDCTVLFITHRPSVHKIADQAFELRDGQLIYQPDPKAIQHSTHKEPTLENGHEL